MLSDPRTTELETALLELERPLRSYLFRLTASPEDAADLYQETCLRVLKKGATFRGESSAKTWIFAVATNLARDHFRARQRWSDRAQDIGKEWCPSEQYLLDTRQTLRDSGSPTAEMEIREHINYCFGCIGKSLRLEQQIALMLKEIYSFKIKEIAPIMERSQTAVKHLLHRARKTMVDLFDARCSLVNKQGMCHQCSEINGIFNPKQNAREELLKTELVREGARQTDDPDRERLFDLRLQLVREIDPLNAKSTDLHLAMLRQTRMAIGEIEDELTAPATGQDGPQ